MSILIWARSLCDNIMVFPGRFRDHILPEQIHILNVSFLVPELRREFGGCAGNIAYNLRCSGRNPSSWAPLGDDSRLYLDGSSARIKLDCRAPGAGTLTAQAFIATDLDDNQITAFPPAR